MRDTIVALSSAAVDGGALKRELQLAIVRLSGPRAIELADGVFCVDLPERPRTHSSSILRTKPRVEAKAASTLADAAREKRWRRVAGHVVWRKHELKAHAYVMPGPRSYTREDVVELHVPGLPWLIDDLLDKLISGGARAAEAGEFTRRAFEHGRLALEQAEAVGHLISSGTAAEARAYAQQLISHVDADRQRLKAGLEDLLSQVELGLDFAHEDVVVIAPEEVKARIEAMLAAARKLAVDSARETHVPGRAVPRFVLVGPTNAGKSMLFNALAGRDAAIVSAERHTTRDAVEAQLSLVHDGNSFNTLLIDSAGAGTHDDKADPLHRESLERSLRAMRSADVVLVALDRSLPMQAHDGLSALLKEIETLDGVVRAVVWTKADLPASNSGNALNSIQSSFVVSALNGEGVEELRKFLAARASDLSRRSAEAHAAAGAARRACARSIAESLERAAGALSDGAGEDALAVELREAIHACWQAEGVLMRHDAVTEAALDKIFSRFCIGK